MIRLRQMIRRLQSLRGVAPAERRRAVRAEFTERRRTIAKRARRRLVTGQVKLVERVAGPRPANWYFWHSPSRLPAWFDVQRRIEYLAGTHPAHLIHFVSESIAQTHDPVAIAAMARHPFSSDELRGFITAMTDAPTPQFQARLQRSQRLSGAFLGAARVLLDPHRAEVFAAWACDLFDKPEEEFLRQADSASWWPAGVPIPGVWSTNPPRVSHRLVIAPHADDLDSLALLLPGAETTTVFLTSDTFGRADFSGYEVWPGVGEIRVEHLRSRITRFSQEYSDIHRATAAVARDVATDLADIPGLVAAPSDVRHLEVEIADFLFFQALKVRAIEVLLETTPFDHIVVGTTRSHPSDEFVRLIAGVAGLTADPRLEIVSISRSAAIRRQFWWAIETLHDPVTMPRSPFRRASPQTIVTKVDRLAQRSARALGRFPPSDRPWVPVVSANNPAYNSSTAAYISELRSAFGVRLIHLGRNATNVAQHLVENAAQATDIDFIAPTSGAYGSFVQLLAIRMTRPPAAPGALPAERAAAWALHCCVRRLASGAVAPAIERLLTLDHWFAEMARHSELPDAIVLTPQRNAGVGAVASAARRYGVPTIAVEPHAQDANYCRYAKVPADYYGVMSEYFRDRTAVAFGAGPERTVVIGSPRQVAPPGYDPETEKVAARAQASARGMSFDENHLDVVFFAQPSGWSHVAEVWTIVLEAATQQDCRVLLKTHPEDPSSRTAAYLAVAEQLGCRDRVVEFDGGPAEAIALADLVLTAYSSAGVDAAIRQTPVVCITSGDHPYPLDLAGMVGAHVARSTKELAALLEMLRSDPDTIRRQASALIERETQFLTGPGPNLRSLVDQAIRLGAEGIRPEHEVPASLFLDGPHPVFPV